MTEDIFIAEILGHKLLPGAPLPSPSARARLPVGNHCGSDIYLSFDFDGDGQADLVWENAVTGQRGIWIMKKGVPAYTIWLPTIPIQWHIAGAADFLGTGQADLVWENTTSGERGLWIMQNGVPAYTITLPTVPIQ